MVANRILNGILPRNLVGIVAASLVLGVLVFNPTVAHTVPAPMNSELLDIAQIH